MTILSKPVKTQFRTGWDMLGGGANNTSVEHNPDAVAAKLTGGAGGSSASAVDMYPFRIVIYVSLKGGASSTAQRMSVDGLTNAYIREQSPQQTITPTAASQSGGASSNPREFSASSPAGSPSASPGGTASSASFDEELHVVAVANTREDILNDWEHIKDGWRSTNGTVDVGNWADFYQRIIQAVENEGQVLEDNAAIGALENDFVPTPSKHRSSGGGAEGEDDKSPSSENFEGSFAGQLLMKSEGLSAAELWAGRVVGAWYWIDIYQSVVLMAIFAHGYWLQWMNVYVALIAIFLSGSSFGGGTRGLEKNERAQSIAEARAEMLKRTSFQAQRIVDTIFGEDASSIEMRGVLASAVLLNFVCAAVGGFSVIVALEAMLPQLVVATLALGFVLTKVFGFQPPTVDDSSVATPGAGTSPVQQNATPSTSTTAAPSSSAMKGAVTEAGGKQQQAAEEDSSAHQGGDDALPSTVKLNFDLFNSEDWTFIKEKDGVQFHSKSVPWCDKKACKFSVKVPGVTAGTLEHILTDDPEGTNKKSAAYTYDRLLEDKKVLQHFERGTRRHMVAVNTKYKAPIWGITPRDMASKVSGGVYLSPEEQVRFKLIDTESSGVGRKVFVQSGINWGKEVPENSGFQRGSVHRYMMVGQETAEGLIVSLCISIDPEGKIPAKVVEMSNEVQIEKLQLIRKILKEKGPMEPTIAVPKGAGEAASPEHKKKKANGATKKRKSTSSSNNNNGGAVTEPPQKVKELFDLINMDGWALAKEKDGVQFHSIAIPWCDKKACKFSVKVPGVTAATLEAIACDDPVCDNKHSAAYTYDGMLDKKFLVKKEDDNNATYHFLYKSPVWGIAPRDLCVDVEVSRYLTPAQQKQFKCEGRHVFVQAGTDHFQGCPEKSGYQRGKLYRYGLTGVEHEDGSGVTVTLTISLDPCGRVPGKLVEMTNSEQIEKLVKMRKLLQERGPMERPQSEGGEDEEDDDEGEGENEEKPTVRICLCGSKQSGRQTLLARLCRLDSVPPPPHKEFPQQQTTLDDFTLLIQDIRNDASAQFVSERSKHADALVYMIDCSGSIEQAKHDLDKLSKMPGKGPLLVLGNKTDVKGAISEDTLSSCIPALQERNNRPTVLFMCSLAQRQGYVEGLRWILKSVASKARANSHPNSAQDPNSNSSNEEVSDAVRLWTQKLYHSTNWNFKLEKDGVTYHDMPTPFKPPDSKLMAVKFSCFVPGAKCKTLDILMNDVSRVKQFDRLIDSKEVLNEVPGTKDVLYHSKFKSPVWGVTARDMITRVTPRSYLTAAQQDELRVGNPEGGERGEVFLHVGQDASKEHPAAKGFVRSEVHCFGFMAQEIPEKKGIQITNCFSMDPCGSIPKSIVSASNAEQVEKLRIIRNLLQDIQKEIN